MTGQLVEPVALFLICKRQACGEQGLFILFQGRKHRDPLNISKGSLGSHTSGIKAREAVLPSFQGRRLNPSMTCMVLPTAFEALLLWNHSLDPSPQQGSFCIIREMWGIHIHDLQFRGWILRVLNFETWKDLKRQSYSTSSFENKDLKIQKEKVNVHTGCARLSESKALPFLYLIALPLLKPFFVKRETNK